MDEFILQIFAALRILWVSIFAYFYGLGGVSNKWIRRYLGTAWLVLGYVAFSLQDKAFSPYIFICYPLLVLATSVGYGGTDETSKKIFKRFYCGLLYAIAALPIAIISGNWIVYALHTFLCVLFSVVLGVTNPVVARYEETLIGLTIGLLPLYMV